ncbi:putative MTH938-like superfamily protein [Arabidopsis thaliana]
MAVRQKAMATLPKLIQSMRNEVTKQPSLVLPSLRRAFSLYDQINLIDNVPEDQLRFQEFDKTSFTVNGVKYEGSLLCVGNLLMSWSPRYFSDITTDRYQYHLLPSLQLTYTGLELELRDCVKL